MTNKFNQIINLVKSKNEKVEHISYKEVYKLKLNPENNINTSIVFNTQNNSSQLIDYSNAYFQFVFNIKFETAEACTKNNLTLKNSYEMIQELNIELNNKIISNEYNTNYSSIIDHILENSKKMILFIEILIYTKMLLNTIIPIKISFKLKMVILCELFAMYF